MRNEWNSTQADDGRDSDAAHNNWGKDFSLENPASVSPAACCVIFRSFISSRQQHVHALHVHHTQFFFFRKINHKQKVGAHQKKKKKCRGKLCFVIWLDDDVSFLVASSRGWTVLIKMSVTYRILIVFDFCVKKMVGGGKCQKCWCPVKSRDTCWRR